jgi:nodulation protein E
MRRVVLTGAGTVNPLGADGPSTLAALAAGRCAIGPLHVQDSDRLSVRIGAAVTGFDPLAHLPPARAAQLDRFAQLAVVAAREALADAGLAPGPWQQRAGAILGTAGGGFSTQEAAYRAVYAEGKARVAPLTVPRLMANAAAAAVATDRALRGPTFAVASACASSNHAIALAAGMIRAGAAPVMLAGGAEAMLSFSGIKAWEALRVLSETGCRPFAPDRDGMVMGEGAGVFVLEDRDHALARGARILAEVAGTAMGAEAGDLVHPSAEAAERVIRAALQDAGLPPGAIHLVKAHGTGTGANDRAEAQALHAVFGPAPPPVIAPKALHGHLIGAAGAVELFSCLLALRRGLLAPVPVAADPALGLDLVQGSARRAQVRACLSNAFAFGGLDAVVVLTAPGA